MKKILPIIILAAAALLIFLLVLFRPEPTEVLPERPTTQIEVITAQPKTVQLSVRSQGTVLPKIESNLAVEVAGRIIDMSPNFTAGGRFTEGEVLFRIDPADYEAALAARKADLAEAELALAQEEALADQAAADWTAMGEGEASGLTLRRPQLARAKARRASAEAALKQAQRDLERTAVKAPYDGLVLSKTVDLGQYVMANPAEPVARIYSTEAMEIRLPLKLQEADFLIDPGEAQSAVLLFRNAPEGRREWKACLLRFESTIDPQSRLIYAVAGVEAPFKKGLRRGLFLEAEIKGKTVDNVFELPRYALRGSGEVYLKSKDGTLVTQEVTILKSDSSRAVITGGLTPGDQVATSPIAYFVENMPVEVVSD